MLFLIKLLKYPEGLDNRLQYLILFLKTNECYLIINHVCINKINQDIKKYRTILLLGAVIGQALFTFFGGRTAL